MTIKSKQPDENRSAEVECFINRFYGYGKWTAPVWFVGMEEGGCPDLDSFNHRLRTWVSRGCRDLEHAKEFHLQAGLTKWFNNAAPLQSTWEKIIRIFLAIKNQPTDKEAVRKYQIEQFGDSTAGEFSSLELFSLPSVSSDCWIYSEIPGLPFLLNRKVYRYYLYPRRAEELRRRIQIHKPDHVVIYGLEYQQEWEGIIGGHFSQSSINRIFEAKLGNSRITMIPHPVSRGIPQTFWTEVGRHLARPSGLVS